MNSKTKIRIYPFLYALVFCLWQYSINDMATSSNAYTLQVQGERTLVYVYLIAILGLLGVHLFSRGVIRFLPTTKPLFILTIWTLADNLILGNIIGSANQWASLTQIGLCAWWFLAIQFGYNYTETDAGKERQIVFFIILMLLYYCYEFVRVAVNNSRVFDQTTVLNLIYRVVVFVPVLFLLNNTKLRNSLLTIIIVLTVISFKRGAIIILPLMLLQWYLVENTSKKITLSQIVYLILLLIAVAILYYFADRETNGFLSYRFSSQQLLYGSNRDVKYTTALNEISNRGFISMLLGIGSSHRSGIHNEVLEVTYTYGLVGLLIYVWYFVSMLKRYRQLLKIRSKYASIYGMIFIYIFVVGLYSGVIFNHSTFYLMLTMGIVERKTYTEELERWQKN